MTCVSGLVLREALFRRRQACRWIVLLLPQVLGLPPGSGAALLPLLCRSPLVRVMAAHLRYTDGEDLLGVPYAVLVSPTCITTSLFLNFEESKPRSAALHALSASASPHRQFVQLASRVRSHLLARLGCPLLPPGTLRVLFVLC